MNDTEWESTQPSPLENRSVINFSKHLVASLQGTPENRVLACWLHVPKGAVIGGKNNRIFVMGFPDDLTDVWTNLDQRCLNREYWENGSMAFGVEPETLFPVDISLWSTLALTADGFKVTFYDAREPIGWMDKKPIYEVINLNGLIADYQGKTRGLDEDSEKDLLIPSDDGWFLHYRIRNSTVSDWLSISKEGESVSCRELLFDLAALSSQ